MRPLANELAAVALFVVTGWAALWPLRSRLGAFGYHGAALPAGLLGASLAGAFSSAAGRPLDAASAAVGATLLVAGVWLVHYVAMPENRSEPASSDVLALPGGAVDVRSFGVAASVIGGLSLFVSVARFTVSNNDSLVSYWPLGVELSRKGAFSPGLMGSRSPLLPSMNAVFATLGSDWAYAIYPLLGATLLYWLATTLLYGPLAGAGVWLRRLVAGGAVAFLALEPSFIFHSFFVHSHMASAVYLLMSLVCLWVAAPKGSWPAEKGPRSGYLVLAGLFTAGLALSRPDGLAYQFVPVAVAISALTAGSVRWRDVLAYFGPLLFVVGGSYAGAYVRLGMWESGKLSGRTTLAILVVLMLAGAGPWIVQWLDRLLPWRVSGERLLALLTGGVAVLMLAVLAVRWESASSALATARINLLQGAGGYHYLWYAVLVLVGLSLFSGDALTRGTWTRSPFLAAGLFFVIAALVHGLSHEGRVGVGDSFNRVAFHVVPVIVWYAAAVVARIESKPAENPAGDGGLPTARGG